MPLDLPRQASNCLNFIAAVTLLRQIIRQSGRGGRVAEGTGLLNLRRVNTLPGVRIPLSPPPFVRDVS